MFFIVCATAVTARILFFSGVPPLGSGYCGIKKPFNAYGMGLFVRSDPYYIRGPNPTSLTLRDGLPSLTHFYHHPIIRVPLPRVWLTKTNPIPTECQGVNYKFNTKCCGVSYSHALDIRFFRHHLGNKNAPSATLQARFFPVGGLLENDVRAVPSSTMLVAPSGRER